MILVAYASKHGSTEGIAQAIAKRLDYRDLDARAHTVHELEDVGRPQAVVLGSAVYAGSWMKDAVRFAEAHAEALADVPVWLFSSGPLGEEIKDEEEQPRQLPELRQLLDPREHRVFFGALDREKLSFSERMIVKAVKAPDGDFRDWDAINGWADEIADELR
ncbi:MAG TPA: flavodoxin domain-containing protein [Actinomycetota bacterium]|jgi:menaquinone-dependent protoporphyrinogen oxidase|nr:flavodoxin domain-containing protein [Actinomycetota bacterium]